MSFFSAENRTDLKKVKLLQNYIKRMGAIWVITPKGKQHIKEGNVITVKEVGLIDNESGEFLRNPHRHQTGHSNCAPLKYSK